MAINEELQPLGPIQTEDAALLRAVVLMTDPKVLVEFGYFRGDSAKVLLSAMSEDALLFSYETTDVPNPIADPRLRVVKESQHEFNLSIAHRVDFAFIDASHNYHMNLATFRRLEPQLSEDAIVAVHDTGLWPSNVYGLEGGRDLPEGYAHRPEERQFVNRLREEFPDFQQIHFHCVSKVRHGMTLLQRVKVLNT